MVLPAGRGQTYFCNFFVLQSKRYLLTDCGPNKVSQLLVIHFFMFTSIKNTKKGFTLIELLVVIAIIGILSSVVLASLSTARQKSRDAKRISDIGQIQLALELFFDANQTYPTSTGASPWPVSNALLSSGYLPKLPVAPSGVTYRYYGATQANANPATECTGAATCLGYVLAVPLERTDNTTLQNDADVVVTSAVHGLSVDCSTTAGTAQPNGTELCYDMKP